MKKLGIFLVFVLGMIGFQSCDDSKTYAELKEEEREAIKRFIEVEGIKVIDEDTYTAQDSVTNVANNEFVFFDESGVYMQIIEKGQGEKMEEGRYEILARYLETKITEDGGRDTLSFNTDSYWSPHPDAFIVTKTKYGYSASFDNYAVMVDYHSSNSVPAGWLIPFNHLRVGREISARSKIRLIVPHSQGTSSASSAVAPCYYEITYQLGPGQ
ncbi:MAG: DUF4827 domain-containing protein [Bacteroidaceae bacterium]|nr:DUF4827 domain-containing protein [Bacteroidaceae bacterium]